MPFYSHMLSDSGFPVGPHGELSEKLIQNLVVHGTADTIRQRFEEISQKGIDEILVLPVIIDDETKEEEAIMRLLAS